MEGERSEHKADSSHYRHAELVLNIQTVIHVAFACISTSNRRRLVRREGWADSPMNRVSCHQRAVIADGTIVILMQNALACCVICLWFPSIIPINVPFSPVFAHISQKRIIFGHRTIP